MNDMSSYPGQELELFEKAIHWKQYFSLLIKPYIKDEVLESGAGLGSNTVLLNTGSARQWLLTEPDVRMATLLEKKVKEGVLSSNCRIIPGDITQLTAIQQFDTIIYIDVLEHIENDKKEIQTAIQHLKPGGHLIILSPAFPFLYSQFDKAIGHFRRYNKKRLKAAIPISLAPIRLHYLDSAGFFLSVINRLLLRQKYPTKKQVYFWDNYLVPLSRIVDKILIYSFGKTILGVWKKEI